MYRYWNGSAWSSTLSATPSAPPPEESADGGGSSTRSSRSFQSFGSGSSGEGRRNPAMWLLIGVIAVIAVVVIAVVVVPRVDGLRRVGADPLPGGQGSVNPCPPLPTAPPTPKPQPGDGRIHGGPISYPQLPSPWSPPYGDTRVPFGRDVYQQTVMVEENYDGPNSWVASVLVAELMAGDGFFSPEEGSEIVARCVTGRFYGNAVVEREDRVNEKATIDGHDAWIIESHLAFDIKNLDTKGELMIIAVIKVDDWRSGLFYASIPDTVPELVEPARQALKEVTVDV